MSSNKVLIIAEAGVNHNGDMDKARKLIDVAAEAKVDLVKFQTFKAETIVSRQAKMAEYQSSNMKGEDKGQFEMLKSLELSEQDHLELVEYCRQKGIGFFSTGFDNASMDFLNELGLEQFKVPSGEITNYPYLKKIASYGKPVILSTGMSNFSEVSGALAVLTDNGLDKNDITVLHCNTEYPTPMKDVNLKAMNTMGAALGVKIGYSDHTLGIEVPTAAVAMGATVIEKHFTLDRSLPGPDHAASLEPNELINMVRAIRNIELAIAGDGEKKPSASEVKNRLVVRKSIFTSREIRKGEPFTDENLIPLRPAEGISPMEWPDVIAKKAAEDLPAFTRLSKTHIHG